MRNKITALRFRHLVLILHVQSTLSYPLPLFKRHNCPIGRKPSTFSRFPIAIFPGKITGIIFVSHQLIILYGKKLCTFSIGFGSRATVNINSFYVCQGHVANRQSMSGRKTVVFIIILLYFFLFSISTLNNFHRL